MGHGLGSVHLISCGSNRSEMARRQLGSAQGGTAERTCRRTPSNERACKLRIRNSGEFYITGFPLIAVPLVSVSYFKKQKIGFLSRWASWEKVVQMHLAFRAADCWNEWKNIKKKKKEPKDPKFICSNRQFSFSIIFYFSQFSNNQIYIHLPPFYFL